MGSCLSQGSVARGLAQESKSTRELPLYPSLPDPPLPGEERPPRDLPWLLGYLHAGVVGSTDLLSADGGHGHIAPELGAGGREEGQRVHAAQRRADHHRGAQGQGVHHSRQEGAGDQLPNSGGGCRVLGTPQAWGFQGGEKAERPVRGEGSFLQKALLGQSPGAARPTLFPGLSQPAARRRPLPRQPSAPTTIRSEVQLGRNHVPIFRSLRISVLWGGSPWPSALSTAVSPAVKGEREAAL